MPELPEVEVVRRGLERWVAHRTVAEAEVLHPRAVRRHLAGADDFTHRLKGHRVGVPSRRGKDYFIYMGTEPLIRIDDKLAKSQGARPGALVLKWLDTRNRRREPLMLR